jgi:uncharacterized membrane protein
MLSGRYPTTGLPAVQLVVNLEINMFWDGLFHAFCWLATAAGLALLWRTTKRPQIPLSTRAFLGSLWFGWGLFNLVEGIIDHHILHVHHVTETSNHLVFDIVFLVFGTIQTAQRQR